MLHQLHYASLDLKEDIPCFEFNKLHDLLEFLNGIFDANEYLKRTEVVYLLAWDTDTNEEVEEDVFVTDNPCNIAGLIRYNFMNWFIDDIDEGYCDENYIDYEGSAGSGIVKIYLQEYESFEEAYKIALAIRENKPNCYE